MAAWLQKFCGNCAKPKQNKTQSTGCIFPGQFIIYHCLANPLFLWMAVSLCLQLTWVFNLKKKKKNTMFFKNVRVSLVPWTRFRLDKGQLFEKWKFKKTQPTKCTSAAALSFLQGETWCKESAPRSISWIRGSSCPAKTRAAYQCFWITHWQEQLSSQ